MNVNITGIYENTIFEDLQLLQTDLSSLVNVVKRNLPPLACPVT